MSNHYLILKNTQHLVETENLYLSLLFISFKDIINIEAYLIKHRYIMIKKHDWVHCEIDQPLIAFSLRTRP